MLPDGPIALQLIGIQLVLNATGPGQGHARPGIKPAVMTEVPVNTPLPLQHYRHGGLGKALPRGVIPGHGTELSSTTHGLRVSEL